MHSKTSSTKGEQFKMEGAGRTILFIALLIITGLFCEWPNFHPEHYLGAGYHWWLDMIFHGGYYFVITTFLYVIFCRGRHKAVFWIAVFLTSGLFEICQSFVPGRSVSWLDLTSNFIGITLATLICSFFYRS